MFLFSVVTAPHAGKRLRTEVGNTSRRVADLAGDDVLSPAPMSGPNQASSPSSPEQGQGSPSRAGLSTSACVDGPPVPSQGSPSRGGIPILSFPPTEPVVVSLGKGSHGADASARSEPAVAQPRFTPSLQVLPRRGKGPRILLLDGLWALSRW